MKITLEIPDAELLEALLVLANKLKEHAPAQPVPTPPAPAPPEEMEEALTALLIYENLPGIPFTSVGVRVWNCLDRAGIYTIEELCRRSEEDLMKLKNFGKTSLRYLEAALQTKGLTLARSHRRD